MPKLGSYAKETKLGRVDRRSKEGRLLEQVRRALTKQLGGEPTAMQVALVERCAMLSLKIAQLDQRILEGGFTEFDAKTYLAFSNSLTRTMAALGIKSMPTKQAPSLADLLTKAKTTRESSTLA